VISAPLFAVIAWRVRRDRPGPVFFRQERLGLNGRPFTMLKFRSMLTDTDPEVHHRYVASIIDSRALPGEHGLFKLEQRDRVTRSGSWLRRTSVDELPQLLNVLRGDMSMVGPSPCLPHETERFDDHHFDRFPV